MHGHTCQRAHFFGALPSGVVYHLSLQMDDPVPLLCVLHHMLITECNMCAL